MNTVLVDIANKNVAICIATLKLLLFFYPGDIVKFCILSHNTYVTCVQYHKTIQCELSELINDVRKYNLGAFELPGNIPAHVNPWISLKTTAI